MFEVNMSISSLVKEKIKIRLDMLVNREWEVIRVDWYSNTDNVGDILNYTLVKGLTGKRVIQVSSKSYLHKHYFVIGSLLDRANRNTEVWGSGFISKNSSCDEPPRKVYAVRGPKTRELLLNQGIEGPEVYGDPALLMPYLFNPKIKKSYSLGIIPHYVDKQNPCFEKFKNDTDCLVIDIQDPNPYNFLIKLLSCEVILSSSLHGIILADAYGIPSQWIRVSDKVLGGDFKFQDYYLSVNRKQRHFSMNIEELSQLKDIESIRKYIGVPTKEFDPSRLLAVCPFTIDLQIPYSERATHDQ